MGRNSLNYYKKRNKDKDQQTATPEKYPQKHFNDKECRVCCQDFNPSAPSELYCSDMCKDYAYTSRYLERTYGITLDDYNAMLDDQDEVCLICKGEGFYMKEEHKLRLVVDHCHQTGKVRGLLCHNCNRGLGLFKDNSQALRDAADYLDRK